jgi:hypothetical protein
MKLVNLIPLKEIDFRNQNAFDAYNKQHKLRPDTKVTIAGKPTTAGKAAQSSEPVKGTSVFGGGDNKKSDDKSGDYPAGSLQYRLQKNNPKDAVKYDNQLKATIKDIADLTDNNDHNGAVMALAKMMGDKSSTAEMEKIQKYHNLKGHMPQSLIKYRSSILNNLLAQAKKKYGDKFAKQLQNSF